MNPTLILNSLKSPQIRDWLHMPPNLDKKCSQQSFKWRNKANLLYAQENHEPPNHLRIWKHYSQSIAHAPWNSDELAVAYSNRASFLMHIGKLDDCMKDVERGLAIVRSERLREKLLTRRELCLKAKAEADAASNGDDGSRQNSVSTEDSRVREIWAKKESENPFDSIAVRQSETTAGRYVVAKRDVKPGEMICAERPQFKCPNLNAAFAYCGHCMRTTWSAIPCPHCTWCMFCSEECMRAAWREYHDVECSVVPYVIHYETRDYYSQMGLRMFIAAVKQAGSIGNLRKRVRTMADEPSGDLEEVIFRDQFKAVYGLSQGDIERHVDRAIQATIMIAKSTSMLGMRKTLFSEDDLFDEDFIFALLVIVKFMGISQTNGQIIREQPPNCLLMRDRKDCIEERCCERGFFIPRIFCFINHSCNPNVIYCFNDDLSFSLFALLPIKKDSELNLSYGPLYFNGLYSERQAFCSNLNFTCKCSACEGKWPAFDVHQRVDILKDFLSEENYAIEIHWLKKVYYLFSKYKLNECIRHNFDRINWFSQGIEEIVSQVTQPSLATIYMVKHLVASLTTVFNHKLIVPSNCNA